jgi:hypothetical protein
VYGDRRTTEQTIVISVRVAWRCPHMLKKKYMYAQMNSEAASAAARDAIETAEMRYWYYQLMPSCAELDHLETREANVTCTE